MAIWNEETKTICGERLTDEYRLSAPAGMYSSFLLRRRRVCVLVVRLCGVFKWNFLDQMLWKWSYLTQAICMWQKNVNL